MSLPPTRYRVVERGRRLVTIDTLTGEEFGAGKRSAPDQATPSPTMTVPPPAAPMPRYEALAFEDRAFEDLEPEIEPAPLSESRSALAPALPPLIGRKLTPGGKLPLLVVGSILFVVFLIATNLWVVVVFAMLIPPVRTAALTKAKAVVKQILDQAAAG